MTSASDPRQTPTQPPLSDLMARYLQRQIAAQRAGFAVADAGGEVTPYEAAPAQPVDPRLAWGEALAVVSWLCPGIDCRQWKVPADWSRRVSSHEPAYAVAFGLGNFPQLVRNLLPLLQTRDLASLLSAERGVGLEDWGSRILRSNPQPAIRNPQSKQAKADAEWQALLANEEAALAWHRGRHEEAAGLWRDQPDSVPVHFNRGMAALFLGDSTRARAELSQAAARLPESSAWHHLARIYLALAETRA